MSSLTGRVFGQYHILDRIGQGGMGTVYRAHDRKSDQDVAIKFISPAIAEQDVFLQRFRREVKAAARLKHPNIVPVLDYGEQGGYAYLVMPLLEVDTLLDRLKEGPLSLELGARVMDQISSALAHAHQHGVIHRDIKPSNILLDKQDNAKLSDFGLARFHDASASLTGPGMVGTPAYMAPEQSRRGQVDARSDQYALGVVLYFLATGWLPFIAKDPVELLLKHINEPFPSARKRNPRVPQSVERVIYKATAKNPKDRFDSVSEMNRALQAAIAHTLDPDSHQAPTVALPETIDPGRRSPSTRTLALRAAAAAAAGLLLIMAVPVFASGVLELLGRAASPAQGGSVGIEAVQLTRQAGTIEAMSTQLAGGQLDPAAIETAIAGTLAAEGTAGDQGGPPGGDAGPAAGTDSGGDLLAGAGRVASTPTPGGVAPAQSATTSGGSNPTLPTITKSPVPGSTNLPPGPTATRTNTPPGPTQTSPVSTTTPTPTQTPAPTATPLPPTVTPLPPTVTPLPPTPTENPCSALDVGGFDVSGKTAEWTVSNGSSTTVTIGHIQLDWPAANGELDRIRFGSSTIWNGSDGSPPSDIGSGFTGNRSLGNGSRPLRFEFTEQADSGGYDLELQLDPGCQVSGGG